MACWANNLLGWAYHLSCQQGYWEINLEFTSKEKDFRVASEPRNITFIFLSIFLIDSYT